MIDLEEETPVSQEEISFDEFEDFEDEISDELEKVDLTRMHACTKINQALTGTIEEIREGYAKLRFTATEEMIVDRHGMIHTGFLFGAADYCSMMSINNPTAVLAVSKVNFLAPMKVGEEAIFEAVTGHAQTRKRNVKVTGYLHDIKFFEGEFAVVILNNHVMSLKLMGVE
jgi:acyl-coenzyme A thioesterase PaaI-like protein